MAVHDHRWQPYRGELTGHWQRVAVLPRYAFKEIFRSRAFVFFLTTCFTLPLIAAVLVYVRHNLAILEELPFDIATLFPVDATAIRKLIGTQTIFGFLMAVVVGPSLLAPDLVNGALPLVLSRPITRRDYLLGKASVLVLLVGVVVIFPPILIWSLEAGLAKDGWWWSNLRILVGSLAATTVVVAILTVSVLAVSALVRTRAGGRSAFVVLVFVTAGMGQMINGNFGTQYGDLLIGWRLLDGLVRSMLGLPVPSGLPLAAFVVMAGLVGAVSLFVLWRKPRAFEVVR